MHSFHGRTSDDHAKPSTPPSEQSGESAATKPCRQCGIVHPEPKGYGYCQCGACLYRYATQKGIPQAVLEEYPIMLCTACGRRVWWD